MLDTGSQGEQVRSTEELEDVLDNHIDALRTATWFNLPMGSLAEDLCDVVEEYMTAVSRAA